MEIKELVYNPEKLENTSLNKAYNQFRKLLDEMRKKNLPDSIVVTVNQYIDELNSFAGINEELTNLTEKKQSKITALLEKELKIVPKNYYRNMWMAVGMAAFGVPLGVAFGLSLGNMAYLGIGMPFGLAIGMGVGASLDKKALEEGKQLDLEI